LFNRQLIAAVAFTVASQHLEQLNLHRRLWVVRNPRLLRWVDLSLPLTWVQLNQHPHKRRP
jgi:hypothetical protein